MSEDKNNNANIDDPYLLSHNYDGIQELDNPMPTWWLITFFATIIFAIIYYFHYEVSKISNSDMELNDGYQAIVALQEKANSEAKAAQPTNLEDLLKDEASLKVGATEFASNCASCHGDKGQGGIGPNLTDKFWLHGKGNIEGILDTVSNGVLDKGMPAWDAILGHDKVTKIAAFVKTLQGTSPPNSKAPQGEEVQ